MSRSLYEFNTYRAAQWRHLEAELRLANAQTLRDQQLAEQHWEFQYRLRRNSLRGTCLIFGDQQKASEKIRDPRVRTTLGHPDTEVRIKIREIDNAVSVLILSGEVSWAPVCYSYSYRAHEVLIPILNAPSPNPDSN